MKCNIFLQKPSNDLEMKIAPVPMLSGDKKIE